MSIWSYHYN